MSTTNLLAYDLGAESGRAVVGRLEGGRIRLDVVHRFANGAVRLPDGLYWDALRLFEEMKAGLAAATQKYRQIASLGVDTWGVDFALLGRGDVLLGNPRHYRDPYTQGTMAAAFARVSRAEIFRRTGVQFLRFNSLYQLLALRLEKAPLLDRAETLLMMPDLFHFWFCGSKSVEASNASTTQMYDPRARSWSHFLVERLGLPSRVLPPLASAGSRLGELRPWLARELGCGPVPVIAPATHDTAAAVAGVPASAKKSRRRTDWCYISSGTWSLVGVELAEPIMTAAALRYNFTNEVGVGHTIRFLKNVMGLWLLQECRRAWERGGVVWSYDKLARRAQKAAPFRTLLDPDDAGFLLPENMPQAIVEYSRRTRQPAPGQPGEFARCILESLALRYCWVIERLEELTGSKIETIHVVGGGCQNDLLNQMTADACGRVVRAGPVEATALGNLMVQAIGLGLVHSLAEARQIIGASTRLRSFEPRAPRQWAAARQRFTELCRV